jgi:hypothetical protein
MNTADIPNTAWRKSSYSNSNSNCVEVAPFWRKSTHSNGSSSCVEVTMTSPLVAVRDTKDRGGPVLTFSPGDWQAFTVTVCDGGFDPI